MRVRDFAMTVVATLVIVAPSAATCQEKAGDSVFRVTRDILITEIIPSAKGTFRNVPFYANSWGMRDKEYSLKPPRNTYRIALLGSSFSQGDGVLVEQTHPWLLEERLNRDGPGAPNQHYEILNFSVGGYSTLQYLFLLDTKVFQFAPNEVIVVLHSIEENRIATQLVKLIRTRIPIPYPFIREQLATAGVEPSMEEPELRRRLAPIVPVIMQWLDRQIVETCRAHHVPLLAIPFIEPPDNPKRAERRTQMAAWASQAGMKLLSMEGAYGTHQADSLHLPGDMHLTVLGHKLVADRLYESLRATDTALQRHLR
jgi:hypothetical protein